jgi:hypothetical protein
MLLRDAVTPHPEPKFARRIAVVVGATTALALAGTIVALLSAPTRSYALPAQTTTFASFEPAKRYAVVDAKPSDIAFARRELVTYASEAFPSWVVDNPARECPRHLLEVNAYFPTLHAVDPWGTPYQLVCGKRLYGVNFMTRSAGPDRAFDTADDLTSMQR